MLALERIVSDETRATDTVAFRWKEARRLAGMTQQELATAMRTAVSTVSGIEQGKTQYPDYETARRAAAAMGTSAEYLLNGDDADTAEGKVPISTRAWLRRRGHLNPSEHLINSIEETLRLAEELERERQETEEDDPEGGR